MTHFENIIYKVASISPLINSIKSMTSPNPSRLPQRSNFKYVDQFQVTRQINRNLYSALKDNFIDKYLFESSKDTQGLYFFYKLLADGPKFFYIGISGTRNGQATYLKERLRKHLITFDYFIYALAFPENYDEYLSDCTGFYTEGKYKSKKETYTRQFTALKLAPFDSIAWIGSDEFSPQLLSVLESHFIYSYKPPANGNKINKIPPSIHESEYAEINEFMLKQFAQSNSVSA
jgi:hypothetical protein